MPGPRFETWVTDEPSERGIDGIERMRLVRDDIATRVNVLAVDHAGLPARVGGAPGDPSPGETQGRST